MKEFKILLCYRIRQLLPKTSALVQLPAVTVRFVVRGTPVRSMEVRCWVSCRWCRWMSMGFGLGASSRAGLGSGESFWSLGVAEWEPKKKMQNTPRGRRGAKESFCIELSFSPDIEGERLRRVRVVYVCFSQRLWFVLRVWAIFSIRKRERAQRQALFTKRDSVCVWYDIEYGYEWILLLL